MATATADDLRGVPLFADLDGRQLKKLAALFRERTLGPGTAVVQEGEMSGVGFFVVGDGTASVTVAGKEVATLGPGDHFGEVALVSEAKRTATITTTSEMRVFEIPFWDFRDFAHANPDVTWKLLQHVVTLLQPRN